MGTHPLLHLLPFRGGKLTRTAHQQHNPKLGQLSSYLPDTTLAWISTGDNSPKV